MKKVFVIIYLMFSNGVICRGDYFNEIVRLVNDKTRGFCMPLDSLDMSFQNVGIVINCWNVEANARRGNDLYKFVYPRLNRQVPKSMSVRNPQGDGYDAFFTERGSVSKYLEYRGNKMNGMYVELHTNNQIKAYMNVSNDCIVGRQVFKDSKGVVLIDRVVNIPIRDMIIKHPPPCPQRLQLSDVNVRKKEILADLEVFLGKNDISALRRAIENLETIGGGCQIDERDFPAIRKTLAELWVRVLGAIEKKYDRNFDYDADPPAINVVAPNPYPAGIAPSSIVEDDLREEYEKAIAENALKLQKSNFNLDLRKIRDSSIFVSSKILVFLYGEKPFNSAEFKEIVQGTGTEELRQKVLSHLKSVEK